MPNSQKGIAQVLVLVLLLAGIASGVYLVQQRTNLLPEAKSRPISCNPKEKDDQIIRRTWTKIEEGKCSQSGGMKVRYQCGKKRTTVKEPCPVASSTPKPTPVACLSDSDCKNDERCVPSRDCPVSSIYNCTGSCVKRACPTPPPCNTGGIIFGDPAPDDPNQCPVYACATPTPTPSP